MPEALLAVAGVATEWLLTYLLHSSVLIGLAWLAVRTGRVRAPESQDVLWKFAALAGIATATAVVLPKPALNEIQITASVDRTALVERRQLRMPEPEQLDVGRPEIGRIRLLSLGEGAMPGPADFADFEGEVSEPSAECRAALKAGPLQGKRSVEHLRSACAESPTLAWYHGLILLWGGGAALGLFLNWRSRREVLELRRSLMVASRRSDQALADVVRGTGAKPNLRVSSVLDAPCVIGRRTIALPERCDRELPYDELRAVLAHEVAHIRRGDVVWLAALRAVTACLWLQPLNRLALQGFVQAAELVCDDHALAHTRQPLGLARSISRVAEWTLSPRIPIEGVVAMAGGDGRSLSGRIRRILSLRAGPSPASSGRRVLAGVGLLLPLLLLPPVPSPVVGHTGIFIQQWGIRTGEDVGHLLPSSGSQPRARQGFRIWLGDGAATFEETVVFVSELDVEGRNSGS